LFLILSHNNKKSFLKVAVKKLTATIQIFYLRPCLSRSARPPAVGQAFRSSLRSSLPACGQGQTGLTENSSLRKKLFPFQPTLVFKKQIAECHQDWRKPP